MRGYDEDISLHSFNCMDSGLVTFRDTRTELMYITHVTYRPSISNHIPLVPMICLFSYIFCYETNMIIPNLNYGDHTIEYYGALYIFLQPHYCLALPRADSRSHPGSSLLTEEKRRISPGLYVGLPNPEASSSPCPSDHPREAKLTHQRADLQIEKTNKKSRQSLRTLPEFCSLLWTNHPFWTLPITHARTHSLT